MEFRGKSWKRDREERGRRQMAQQDYSAKKDQMDVENKTEDRIQVSIKSEPENSTLELKRKAEELENAEKAVAEAITEKEKGELMQYISEVSEKLKFKAELRQVNINAEGKRPEEHFFSKLDSNLKKNTNFIKRLRNMTELQRESLIKDMDGLNLTKYISEAASAIVDAKLKMSDVSTAVQICSLLHRRYAEFSGQLLEHWQKVLPLKKDEKITNPSKIRVDLRFYAELVSCGLFQLKEGLPMLGNLLTVLTGSDKEEHSNVGIVLSFCRHCGEDYTGIVPRKYRLLSEKHQINTPKSDFLAPDRQKGVRNLLKDYYRSLCKHLVRDYKALENMESQNHRILQTKGELSAERKEKFETAQNAFQKLLSNTEQFSDIIDEDMPNLPKDESLSQDEVTTLDVHNRFKDKEMFDGSLSAWEDDDTRSFYENLQDLKAFIPGILFKDSSQSVAPNQSEAVEKLEEDLSQLEGEDTEILEAETKEELKDVVKGDDKDLTETLMQEMYDTEEDTAITNIANKALFDHFLLSLLQCVNREIIDQAATDFCMNLNTRPNRKKLVRALFLVPRTRLDLLPFYSRFVATLNPCMPDVASELVSMLKQDFKFHIKKKDQINIESKVKTVRFIGELVKFKIFPKSEALYCLKLLLCDFIHHHVEMACNLLETCGRFLYQASDSHQRIKVLLEQMMRKKAVLSIDSRYTTMIENAFYYCNPPEVAPMVKKERPPLHEYIRKLLYQDLTKTINDKVCTSAGSFYSYKKINSSDKQSPSARVLRQLRKMNWDDADAADYITKCFIGVWNVKFYNIRCLANLLAGLVAYQENVGPQVVDGVLEDIRLGLEVNHPKLNQRRVSMIRYLGELYNYRMVESTVIFRVLYMLITFEVYYDGTYSELDPPENLFRIRLVCTLLDTCGQYFNSGSSKKKLDYFLIFFQRYYWLKRSSPVFTSEFPFPVYDRYMVEDTIANLRPRLKVCESMEAAEKAVLVAMEELKPKYEELYPDIMNDDPEKNNIQKPPVSEEDSLCPIEEEDEEFDEDAQSVSSMQDAETEGDTDGYSGSQSQPFDDDGEGLGRQMSLSDADTDPAYDGETTATVVKPVGQPAQCPEDDDFMTAFDKMLSDSILHRNQESVKPQLDIVIPMNIKNATTKKTSFIPPKITSAPAEIKEPENQTINFVLMTRRGNKQQFKNLAVPISSELAQNLKDREEAERMEKQHVKLLTLNINERQEEEDYQEMLASVQRPSVVNLNRDRRPKYHHPKGAPDVDLIFGNK